MPVFKRIGWPATRTQEPLEFSREKVAESRRFVRPLVTQLFPMMPKKGEI